MIDFETTALISVSNISLHEQHIHTNDDCVLSFRNKRGILQEIQASKILSEQSFFRFFPILFNFNVKTEQNKLQETI